MLQKSFSAISRPIQPVNTTSNKDVTSPVTCWCGGILQNSVHPLYLQCVLCNTHVVKIKYTSQELKEFYTLDAYWHEHQTLISGYPAIEERVISDFNDRIPYWFNLVSKYASKKWNLLEIGCSHGGFLSYCRDHGIQQVVGVEVDVGTCKFAQNYFNLHDIYSGLFPDIKLPIDSFDVITGFDVIEHFADPVAAIKAVRRLLSNGGTFIFQTPCYRGEADTWQQFRPEEHIYLYNEFSIKKLFLECGLEITDIITGCFPDDMFVIGHKVHKEKIIFMRTDSIGDNVIAMSMLTYLNSWSPDAEITVLCQEHIAELYESCPFIHNIITFNETRAINDEAYLIAKISQIQALRADICLNSVYSRKLLSDIFALCSGASRTITHQGDSTNSFQKILEHNNSHYTSLVPCSGEFKSEIERHYDFLHGIGINCAFLKPVIWLRPDDETFSNLVFEEFNFLPEKTVVLFAGAQDNLRTYHHYGIALSKICQEQGLSVIALGASSDFTINQNNLDEIGVPTLNLCGKLSLRESAAIISQCGLAVGAETGLAHIACAVSTPNVIILGGGHFGRFMPYSPLTSAVCIPLECYRCNWKCPFNHAYCVQQIAPNVLYQALKHTLAKTSPVPRVFVQSTEHYKSSGCSPQWKPINPSFLRHQCEVIITGAL
jgi:ADP-heptose:LPS heptosyltransferase/2-polyprenyl-3-methyl-5-hydroxy-6-metoxy-1,4-benzoquinol methylase